jgi:uncharacterized protein (DUF3084 family)
VDADFARRLERERDEARIMHNTPTPETDVLWDRYQNEMTQGGQFAVGPRELYDHARRMERERDDLLTRLTAIEHRMPEELARLEHQRDRLAEALERIDYCLSNAENVMHGAGSDDITIARRIIIDALAAAKGGEP